MISVIKANQSREEFSEQKVIQSIKRAHIPENIQSEVLKHVKSKIYDNIPTSEIYHHIIEYLGESPHPFTRTRYSLKESIMALGPTGYPFEDYVAQLLETQGYKTQTRQILNGKCITHETDVIAEKNEIRSMIEAKFHNSSGTRSDVHVALYTNSRFHDVKKINNIHEAWIVTNTKTTSDANAYADCVGMKIISWDYPQGQSLRELIEKSGLYPITILSSLNQSHRETLLNNHVVLCKNIHADPAILNNLPLSKEEREKTLAEVNFLCG
jgi:Holliday junction resolvase-like predicted endonuclease